VPAGRPPSGRSVDQSLTRASIRECEVVRMVSMNSLGIPNPLRDARGPAAGHRARGVPDNHGTGRQRQADDGLGLPEPRRRSAEVVTVPARRSALAKVDTSPATSVPPAGGRRCRGADGRRCWCACPWRGEARRRWRVCSRGCTAGAPHPPGPASGSKFRPDRPSVPTEDL